MKKKPGKAFWIRLILFLVCGALVVRIIAGLGWTRVWALSREADPLLLWLSLFSLVGFYVVWAIKWLVITRRDRKLSPALLFRLVMAGSFINLVTPTARLGGGFFRAMVLDKRCGIGLPKGFGLVLSDQASGFVGKMLLMSGFCLAAITLSPELEQFRSMLLPAGLCSLSFALLWPWLRQPLGRRVLGFRGFLTRRLSFLQRFEGKNGQDWLKQVLDPTVKDGHPLMVLSSDLVLSALSFALFCVSNGLVLQAMGCQQSLIGISIVMVLGYLIGSFTGIMGGAGATELALIQLYGAMGIDEAQAAAGALIHRSLFYVFVLVAGGYCTWRDQF